MDGFTYVLSFKAAVNAGSVNTIKIGIADGGDAIYDSNLLIMGDSIQTVALAMDDKINVVANSTRTFDILANDTALNGSLTITQINGQNVVAGQTITLTSGQTVTLNADGTITVQANGVIGLENLTYTVSDGTNTDVGYITLNTTASLTKDGIVSGTSGDDVIDGSYLGDPDGDLVDANDATGVQGTTANDDVIYAGSGNDLIYAGIGNDRIFAGNDNDTVYGGAGNDYAELGNGDDLFAESDDNDTVYGGYGNDSIDGGVGNDLLVGDAGNDTLDGGQNSDTLLGGDGADRFTLTQFSDNDVVQGGEGGLDSDTLAFSSISAVGGINVTFTGSEAGTYNYGSVPLANGTFTQIEVIEATSFNDVINASANTGAVTVYGGAGTDTLLGGSGADSLQGDDGNDSISGGAGADTISGGAGNDTLSAPLDAGDQVDGGEQTGDNDVIDASTQTINQTVTFSGDDSGAFAGGGTFQGIEAIVLGSGNDVVNLAASTVGQTIQTGAGDDQITEGSGNSVLSGGDGNDLITDGTGNDTLDGGAGADTISVFTTGGSNVISGGETGLDQDVLTLTTSSSGGGVNVTLTGDEAGNLQFTSAPSQVTQFTGIESFVLTSGNDVLNASLSNASVSVSGGAGNDVLTGSTAGDSLGGGGDADLIYAAQNDTVVGGETGNDNDTLVATGVVQVIYGGVGNESGTLVFSDGQTLTFSEIEHLQLNGGAPDAIVHGTAGNDVMNPGYVDAQGDIMDGGDGPSADPDADDVFAGSGDDTVNAGAGADQVYGGDGNDSLQGGAGNDYMQGDAGDDTLDGGLGDDFLRGDAGNDLVQGGDGNDSVYGGANDDLVYGGANDDQVFGGFGTDTVYGGTGNDSVTGSGGNDAVYGDDGEDFLQGSDGNDTLTGGAGNDTLLGEEDADSLYASGGDYVDGGETFTTGTDNDTLYVSGVTSVYYTSADKEDGIVHFADGTTLNFYNIETLYVDGVLHQPDYIVTGSNAADEITTTYTGDPDGDLVDAADNQTGTNDDVIDALGGNDAVLAGDGNDIVYAGGGDDTVYGGAGDDLLDAGAGNDQLYGDLGNDTLTGGSGNNLLDGGDGNDSLSGDDGADTLNGGAGADTMLGGAGDDELQGQGGADLIDGGAGNDQMSGGADNDTLTGGLGLDMMDGGLGDDSLSGDGGDDTLSGKTGNDTLSGDGGNDMLEGTFGNDVLTGGAGDDRMYGGDDRDLFFGGAGDVIDGGAFGDDFDVLNLRAYDPSQLNILYGGSDNQSGTVQFLDAGGNVIGSLIFSEIEQIVACFTSGTAIQTDLGDQLIEDIEEGTLVLSRDDGFVPVLWSGSRVLSALDLAQDISLQPVEIAAGALGRGLPNRTMMVSPQHRVLFTGPRAELMFAEGRGAGCPPCIFWASPASAGSVRPAA